MVTGLELLARLAVLVPPPRVHTIRFFGVLAPRAKMRAQVVTPGQSNGDESVACCASAEKAEKTSRGARRRRYSWSALLRRVFAIDVGSCPRCGKAGMQRVSVIMDPGIIRAMLACIARNSAAS